MSARILRPPEIDPRTLPELRAELVRSMRSDVFRRMWRAVEAQVPSTVPRSVGPLSADGVLDRLIVRLEHADLYAVDPAMWGLVEAAAQTFPGYRLNPDDIPSAAGFCVWPTAIGVGDDTVPLLLTAWEICQEGVWLAWFGWLSDAALSASARLAGGGEEGLHLVRTMRPRGIAFDSDLVLEWAEAQRLEVRTTKGTDMSAAVRRLLTTWLIMGEPYTAQENMFPSRASRRRLAASCADDAPLVRLLTLRRHASDGGRGTGPGQYRHQWVVRGHWRQQWYPSRHEHRPRYIAPHLAGPEGSAAPRRRASQRAEALTEDRRGRRTSTWVVGGDNLADPHRERTLY